MATSTAEDQSFGGTRGKLLLRRRLKINRELIEIADDFDRRKNISDAKKQIEFVSSEQFLLNELYSRGDPKLQDIVKTIQKEQDDIIRSRPNHVVVINGVAGSGKTSIAIHRMAYLLYPANQTKISAKRSIIFCPNPIFLHYIEDLLPSLGEKDVQQTTFVAWALERLRRRDLHVVDSSQEIFLDPHSDRELLRKHWSRARLKGNLKIKELIGRYIEHLKHTQPQLTRELAYRQMGELQLDFVFTPEDVRTVIQANLEKTSATLIQIRENAWAALKELVRRKYDDDVWAKSDAMKQQAAAIEQIATLIEDAEEQKLLLDEAKEKRKSQESFRGRAFGNPRNKDRICNLVDVLLQQDFNRIWPPIDSITLYYNLFENLELLQVLTTELYKPEDVELLISSRPGSTVIEMEDIAAILYFHEALSEVDQTKYDHIIVDEVQDFSPMQLEIIHAKSTNHSLTLVGDMAQGIHAHRGSTRWGEIQSIFHDDHTSFHNVSQSYRSSAEIVQFSNRVLQNLQKEKPLLGIPFNRHGVSPALVQLPDQENIKKEIVNRLQSIRKAGYKNIAVITKTLRETIEILAFLEVAGYPAEISIKELESEFKYGGGLIVLPVILTKGLEFQAVIICDANEINYSTQKPYDGRLLYVAITRALHELHILYTGQASGFLLQPA